MLDQCTIRLRNTFYDFLRTCSRHLALLVIVIGPNPYPIPQANPKPYTPQDIIELLKGDVFITRVKVLVIQHDITFDFEELSDEQTKSIGAPNVGSAELLEFLRTFGPQVHFKAGRDEYNQGHFDASKKQFEIAVRDRPSFTDARYFLAKAELAIGTFDEARLDAKKAVDIGAGRKGHELLLQIYEKSGNARALQSELKVLTELDPSVSEFHFRLAQQLSADRRWPDAIAEYNKAIDADEDFKHYDYHLALLKTLKQANDTQGLISEYKNLIRHDSSNTGFTEELKQVLSVLPANTALRYYDEMVSDFPNSAYWHGTLAAALETNGEKDKAIHEYQVEVKLNPANESAHENLAHALADSHRLGEAVAEYKAASTTGPYTAALHKHIGSRLENDSLSKEAIAEYRLSLALAPEDWWTRLALARCLDRTGDFIGAAAESREAIRLNPNNSNAHSMLGSALVGQNKIEEAIVEYRSAITIDPKNFSAQANLGLCFALLKQFDQAIAQYRLAMSISPTDAWTHVRLGIVLSEKNDLDAATAEFRQAIKLDPQNFDAHESLGNSLFFAGKLSEAIPEYKTAVTINPGSANAHFNMGIAYQRKGQADQAIAEFEQTLKIDPKYETATSALRQLEAAKEERALRAAITLRTTTRNKLVIAGLEGYSPLSVENMGSFRQTPMLHKGSSITVYAGDHSIFFDDNTINALSCSGLSIYSESVRIVDDKGALVPQMEALTLENGTGRIRFYQRTKNSEERKEQQKALKALCKKQPNP